MRLRAVILDWAGTVVDFGSRAPVTALQCVFANAGVPVTIAEARESMGLAKKEHIRTILEIPRVRAAWVSKHVAEPAGAAVYRLSLVKIPITKST
jgi:phosphonoacetaldehyde hydrolase